MVCDFWCARIQMSSQMIYDKKNLRNPNNLREHNRNDISLILHP
jgi:hypothetical protein